jgi:hypothetical protein
MRLTLKEADDILQAEINWCLDNPDPDLNHDQRMGFMNGLRQAQTLLRLAEEKKIASDPPRNLADYFMRF